MATVLTDITPTPDRFGFTGVPALAQQDSAIPLAELAFTGQFEAVTASGVGDDQLLRINCDLPQAFAYVVVDVRMDLQVGSNADMAQWDDVAYGLMRTAASGSEYGAMFEGFSAGIISNVASSVNAPRKIYSFEDLPKMVLIPSAGKDGTLVLQLSNPSLNSSAGFVSYYIRVLQYNITQAHHFQVNTPIPIR